MPIRHIAALSFWIAAGVVLPAGTAHAYVGPGLGLGTVAIVLGVILSIVLAVFAVVWYPLKRMLRRLKRKAGPVVEDRERE
jgi:hypothetical protein